MRPVTTQTRDVNRGSLKADFNIPPAFFLGWLAG